MILEFILIVVFHVCAIIAYLKVGWHLAIYPEMFAVFLMLCIPYAFFRRCPVCGKRTLTLDFDNFDSGTDIGICRNCESHIYIQKRGYNRDIYYVENEHGQKERVVPFRRRVARLLNM